MKGSFFLRAVGVSDWIGKALLFPRALLPQVKARPELAQTGGYLLCGACAAEGASAAKLLRRFIFHRLLVP